MNKIPKVNVEDLYPMKTNKDGSKSFDFEKGVDYTALSEDFKAALIALRDHRIKNKKNGIK